MALTSHLSVAVSSTETSALDLTTASAPYGWGRDVALASGTAAGQADLIYTKTRTLSASATEDLDLAGSLVGALGGSGMIFVKIKGLFVAAAAGNTNNVVIGNATSNAWAALLGATGTVTIRPGAVFSVIAGLADATGYAVTAGTGDLLKVANSAGGTSVSYDILVIGTSA